MADLLSWLMQQGASRQAMPADGSNGAGEPQPAPSFSDRPNGLMADPDLITRMLGAYLAGPALANRVAMKGASDLIGLPGDAVSAVVQAGQRMNGAKPNPSQTAGPLPGTNDLQGPISNLTGPQDAAARQVSQALSAGPILQMADPFQSLATLLPSMWGRR